MPPIRTKLLSNHRPRLVALRLMKLDQTRCRAAGRHPHCAGRLWETTLVTQWIETLMAGQLAHWMKMTVILPVLSLLVAAFQRRPAIGEMSWN
jgi:hypothetical protein